MASRHSYSLIAAGSVGKTLIGRLSAKSMQIGAVAAVSYRVASRIANSIRAGWPVREVADLDGSTIILFHSPPDQIRQLMSLCFESGLRWQGRTVIFCDCEPPQLDLTQFHRMGAAAAIVRSFGLSGYAAVRGCPLAVPVARRIARDAGMRPLEMAYDRAETFAAAITLGTAALTALLDRAAWLLRSAGIRDADSIRVTERLFQQTVRGYAHSGRQSWSWHINPPAADDIEAQIGALDPAAGAVMRQLLLLGFDSFDKHPDVAALLRTDSRS